MLAGALHFLCLLTPRRPPPRTSSHRRCSDRSPRIPPRLATGSRPHTIRRRVANRSRSRGAARSRRAREQDGGDPDARWEHAHHSWTSRHRHRGTRRCIGFHAGVWLSTYGLDAERVDALQRALTQAVGECLRVAPGLTSCGRRRCGRRFPHLRSTSRTLQLSRCSFKSVPTIVAVGGVA